MKVKYFKNPAYVCKFAENALIAHIITKGEYIVVFYYDDVKTND